jgi:hypothetical protein
MTPTFLKEVFSYPLLRFAFGRTDKQEARLYFGLLLNTVSTKYLASIFQRLFIDMAASAVINSA